MFPIRTLADLLAPRHCCVCSRQLGAMEDSVCIWCLSDLPQTWFWSCERNPMADRFNSMVTDSRYCFAAALFYYRKGSPYREITRGLKYRREMVQGQVFGKMLANKLLLCAEHNFDDVDVVIPVPLHWTRQLKRGYNQAEVIARPLAKSLGAKLETGLIARNRRTKTQTTLDKEAKRINVEGAFSTRSRKLEKYRKEPPSHILLVDDVFTTGATVAACHRALRKVFGPEVRISAATLGYSG